MKGMLYPTKSNVQAKQSAGFLVLDACCGTRMFWYDPHTPYAIYGDQRKDTRIIDKGTPGTRGRKPKSVTPTVLADFRNLPFKNNSFYHVVFDPPHYTSKKIGATGRLAFDYGTLGISWREDIRLGFCECFRVLRPFGTLIFKWCEIEIPLQEVLKLSPISPMYGHKSGRKAQTHWCAFLKTEELATRTGRR